MSKADLTGADLSGANLTGANLNGANLNGANLTRANLYGADLSGAKIDDTTVLDDKWRLVWEIVNRGGAGKNLSGAYLFQANLSGAILSGAILDGANLTRAYLFQANLTGADLTGAKLTGAKLTRANLTGAKLQGADLQGANLSRADLYRAYLYRADLTGADLTGADLTRADLNGAKLTRADLNGANLNGADLSGANLSGANLDSGILLARTLESAVFTADSLPEDIRREVRERGAFVEEPQKLRERGTLFEEPQKLLAEVEINLPGEEVFFLDQKRVVNAAGAFMEALGFELEAEEEPVQGSFFQRLKFLTRKALTSDEAQQLYEEGKDALRVQLHDKPAADSTAQLAAAARDVIGSLDKIPNAAVRLGTLVVVKVTDEDGPRVLVETISLKLQHKLDDDPQFLRNPKDVMAFLDAEQGEAKALFEPTLPDIEGPSRIR